ncbi:hypothetical protein BO82DRAFT_178965 [Aspergillus uvarum CBS 121591]|uniref:Uncharacterized protein n=1 Tax=Aspergillus uvarum CBS 121591 TaxID=1448315 RepID=A0A319BXG1_9EURO|nr:hypothetical protein BO82DRAFT_178965 [Aspergillus uvarum CBS 121591]PYH77414.1 hypothetical protein BO82DRAFT_178965 [Aspergillus uvarum CBS 121591]
MDKISQGPFDPPPIFHFSSITIVFISGLLRKCILGRPTGKGRLMRRSTNNCKQRWNRVSSDVCAAILFKIALASHLVLFQGFSIP